MVRLLVRIRIVIVIHVWWELQMGIQHLCLVVVAVPPYVGHIHDAETRAQRILLTERIVSGRFLSVWDGGSFPGRNWKL